MANEAGQGCQNPGSTVGLYTFIDNGNKAIAGDVTALRAYKGGSASSGTMAFAFGTMATNDWTGTSGKKGDFADGTAEACYEFLGGGVDFTTFSVSVDEFLAAYVTKDAKYSTSGGPGHWRKSGDYLTSVSEAMAWDADGDTSFGADITAGGEELEKNLDDTITMSDARIFSFGLNKSDTITLSDNISMVVDFIRTLNDTINLSDETTKSFETIKADTITLSDNIESMFLAILLNLNDTINLSDNIAKNVGTVKSDTINIADNFNRVMTYLKAFADTIILSDLNFREIGLNKADTITLSDSITKQPGLNKSDIIALSDSVSKELGLNKADTITLSDFFSSDAAIILAVGKITATITGRGPSATITGRGPSATITGK